VLELVDAVDRSRARARRAKPPGHGQREQACRCVR
jgi:hypothetical protein